MTRAYRNKPLQNLHHMQRQKQDKGSQKPLLPPGSAEALYAKLQRMTEPFRGPTEAEWEALFRRVRTTTAFDDRTIIKAFESFSRGLALLAHLDYAELEVRALASLHDPAAMRTLSILNGVVVSPQAPADSILLVPTDKGRPITSMEILKTRSGRISSSSPVHYDIGKGPSGEATFTRTVDGKPVDQDPTK